MYVVGNSSGAVVFRYDHRMHGRRETRTLGRYGPAGLSLARAREKFIDAQRSTQEGWSPAQEKQREKRRIKEAKSFGEFGQRWLQEAKMADSTRAMRRSVFERDILPVFRNRLLLEIAPEGLRTLRAKAKERGGSFFGLGVNGCGYDAVVAVRAEAFDASEFGEPVRGTAAEEHGDEIDRLGDHARGTVTTAYWMSCSIRRRAPMALPAWMVPMPSGSPVTHAFRRSRASAPRTSRPGCGRGASEAMSGRNRTATRRHL